jgi:hypothetical protein
LRLPVNQVLAKAASWFDENGAYAHLQGTRPNTPAYALNDSPAGLAAWIVEKFREWSDCDGDVYRSFSHYGAGLADARVVVDGIIMSAAGVTAGLDAALVLVSLLRGDAAAQEIQLAIEYAPDPVFHSGTPDTAPPEVLESFLRKYKPIGVSRETEALRHAAS